MPIPPQPLSENIPISAIPGPSPKKSHLWIFIPLFVLVISALAVFAYQTYHLKQQLAQIKTLPSPNAAVSSLPSTDLTANWKTYSTNKYSFKYPNGWSLEDGQKNDCQVLLTSPNNSLGAPQPPLFYVSVYPCDNPHPGGYNFGEHQESTINRVFSIKSVGDTFLLNEKAFNEMVPFETYMRLKDTPVENVPGITIEGSRVWEGSVSLRHRIIYIKMYNGFVYVIGGYYDKSVSSDLEYFDQTLSTFKFTN